MSAERRDPVLADASAVRALPGLSGARIYLVTRDDRRWFVRKAARDEAQSVRLRGQAAKQARFAESARGALETPRILGEGTAEGRYYFDMEFIRGPDGATHLRRASFAEVVAFTDRLCRYLEVAAAEGPIAAPPAAASGRIDVASGFEALYAKLCEVERRTRALDPAVLARIFLALDRLRARRGSAPTLCHGDLTLENLVIDETGRIWVLDLLDSPFEHWWQDVAKLHQDLSGGWYLRRQAPVALGVTQYVSRRLLEVAARLSDGYREVHATLVAFTFVRILPYVTSEEERRFVLDRIAHFAEQCS